VARVLTVNAGSSSLKLSLLAEGSEQPLAARELPAQAPGGELEQLREALAGELASADCVAHRIVHGGERFRTAVLIDAQIRAELEQLTALAPLHQPLALAMLDATTTLLPELPAVACFDTAFHATLPEAASTFALPAAWRERFRLRRYGFHGLSHAHVARQVAQRLGPGIRLISCHLGAGASLCAIRDGRSLDTTMGFTPLDGLVMATRSGSVDPGLILWLLEHGGLSEAEVADGLEHQSGLLGLAASADMRTVLAARAAGDPLAKLAIGVYVHRLRASIGSMLAALQGVDVIAFTGGIGENSHEIREEALAGLQALIGGARVLVVAAREDLEMARQAHTLV
jgi:acetate kinase